MTGNVIQFYEYFQHRPLDRSIKTSATVIILPIVVVRSPVPVDQPFKLPRVRRRARTRVVKES